jgi:hypothetical protein
MTSRPMAGLAVAVPLRAREVDNIERRDADQPAGELRAAAARAARAAEVRRLLDARGGREQRLGFHRTVTSEKEAPLILAKLE